MRVTGPDVSDRVERTGAEALTENEVVAERVVITVAAAAPDAALYAIWNVAVSEVGVVTTLRTRDARITRGERRAREVRAGEADVDRFTYVAGVGREGRDGRSAYATRVAGDGEQISNGVVGVRGDIALSVDHLREPSQVVVDILGLVGNGLRRHNRTEHQHTDHSRQQFG